MKNNKIIVLGNLKGERKIGQRSRLYSWGGLSPTISSTIYKEPNIVLVKRHGKQHN